MTMTTTTKAAKRRTKVARKNRVIPEMVDFGKRLRQAREQKNMTQADLAAKAATSEQDIGQLENGWRSVSLVRAHYFAKYLSVTPEWLIVGINPKTYAALVTGAKHAQKALKALASESGEHVAATA
jgi:transcriptional regulator with XRE-family HTH domain